MKAPFTALDAVKGAFTRELSRFEVQALRKPLSQPSTL
ncbi:hypothetical protein C791_1684 [Amycolatopsis azurea DSM 43854]|uniref:Uncharacterized protein n=1 Tax=Amycolatopsis azurea DSM 43854 TaxID=1238180 RepID=M2PT62_9PSEU|nr:hypothetical protein C791_1684 [Amycolatopsis azurea DSM 43854]